MGSPVLLAPASRRGAADVLGKGFQLFYGRAAAVFVNGFECALGDAAGFENIFLPVLVKLAVMAVVTTSCT